MQLTKLMEFRKQNPEYNTVPDGELASRLQAKFYADVPTADFLNNIGYVPPLPDEDDFGSLRALERINRPKKDEGTLLSRTKDTFNESVGERIGLDPENFNAVHDTVGFLTPVVDAAAALGDIALGTTRSLAGAAGEGIDAVTPDALKRNPNQSIDRTRKEFIEFVDMASLFAGGANSAVRRAPTVKPTRVQKQATKQLDKVFKLDGPPVDNTGGILLDTGGENLRALARGVGSRTGKGRTLLETHRDTVLANQSERFLDIARNTLSKRTDYFAEMQAVSDQRARAAAPLYEKAYTETIKVSKNLRRAVERPFGQKGVKQAIETLKNQGIDATELGVVKRKDGKLTLGREANIQLLDAIKRGLGDKLPKPTKPDARRVGTEILQGFTKEIDAVSPNYAAARAAYAGPSQLQDALERGRDLFSITVKKRASADDVKAALKQLNESEREFFRSGALRALSDEINSTSDGANAFTRIARSKFMRDKLRALFPDDQAAADDFVDLIQSEADRVKAAIEAAPRQSGVIQTSGDGLETFTDLASGNVPSSLLRRGLKKLETSQSVKRQQAIDEELARRILGPVEN